MKDFNNQYDKWNFKIAFALDLSPKKEVRSPFNPSEQDIAPAFSQATENGINPEGEQLPRVAPTFSVLDVTDPPDQNNHSDSGNGSRISAWVNLSKDHKLADIEHDDEYDNGQEKKHPYKDNLSRTAIICAAEMKKKRQLLLVLPLLVLPFITMAFWALGGGKGAGDGAGKGKTETGNPKQAGSGINTTVPAAELETGLSDKMAVYRQSQKLARERGEVGHKEGVFPPNDSIEGLDEGLGGFVPAFADSKWGINSGAGSHNNEDPNSLKVQQKLEALQKIINSARKNVAGTGPAGEQTVLPENDGWRTGGEIAKVSPENTAEFRRLDQLKEMITTAGDMGDDVETDQINAMLDKVLAIQKGYNTGSIRAAGRPGMQQEGEPGHKQVPLLKDDLSFGTAASKVENNRGGKVHHLTPIKPVRDVPLLEVSPSKGLSHALIQKRTALQKNPLSDRMIVDRASDTGIRNSDLSSLNDHPSAEYLFAKNTGKIKKMTDQVDTRILKGAFYDIDGNHGGLSGQQMDEGGGYDFSDGESNTKGESGVDNPASKAAAAFTIRASVATDQTLVSGSTVKLRLDEDVLLNGTVVPKGSFLFGACKLNGERLCVTISHIIHKKQLMAVNLTVFDLDGMEGIHIPGSINREAVKQGAERGLSGVQLMSMDPSVAAQAASAGVEAAKGLFSKKVRLVRVLVKAGYPILLVDSGQ